MTKILLVEDDNNLREIYEARLAAEGFEIVSAQNGEEALATASKEHPDMIISDVMMPKISGFEMLDILRNTDSLKNVKIIMLTALGQAEDSARANSLGADRYLVKSQVTLEDIVKAAHELLDNPGDSGSSAAAYAEELAAAPQEQAPEAEAQQSATNPAITPMPQPVQQAQATPVEASMPEGLPVVAEPTPVTEAPPQVPATQETTPPEVAAPASIPVVTGDDNTQSSAQIPVPDPVPASEPANDTGDISGMLQVVEPPDETNQQTTDATVASDINIAAITPDDTSAVQDAPQNDTAVQPSPGADTPQEQPEDYTSPTTFNTFQAPLSVPDATENIAAADVQTVVEEEASIKSQIDEFINSQSVPDTSEQTQQAPEVPAATEAENQPSSTAEPSLQPEQPSGNEASAPIKIPVFEASDEPATETPEEINPPVASDPEVEAIGFVEPEPENLDTFKPPVISAPTEQSTTETPAAPQPVQETVPDTTAENTANISDAPQPQDETPTEQPSQTDNDQLFANAAAELAVSDNAEAQDQAPARKKVISPIGSSESKPDIHQLLAKEEARASAQQAAASIPQSPQPNVSAYGTPQSAAQPPVQASASGNLDPNSISL